MNHKFRFWSIEKERMTSWQTARLYSSLDHLFTPEYSVMQYTGYADYDGEGIYEGDILARASHPTAADGRYLVKLAHGTFTGEHLGNKSQTPLAVLHTPGLKIIGNAHQNPELLSAETPEKRIEELERKIKQMEKLKHFSLFSGIESFKKALTNLGIENELVGYSEIDKYASVALAAIHGVSEELNYGDITKIDETKLPDCDLITYGFPCQDISIAGLGKGIIEGETRSGLLFDALRIIKYKKPKYAIAENVKNLVGKRFKEDFEGLLAELESYGYNNYWKVLNAKDYGIPQNRERVFVVSIRKDVDTGYEFPKGFDNGLRLKDLLEDEVEEKYYIDNERTSILLNNLKEQEGINVSKQGKAVASYGASIEEISMRLGGLFDSEGRKRLAGAVWDKESIGPTLDTMQGGHREPLIIESYRIRKLTPKEKFGRMGRQAVETYNEKQPNYGDTVNPFNKTVDSSNNCPTITTRPEGFKTAILPATQDYRIRKLTPKECWRLMGFTDEDYHKARQALEDRFYNGRDRSNSQMYKMAGNSIVVDVLEGILKNLKQHIVSVEWRGVER